MVYFKEVQDKSKLLGKLDQKNSPSEMLTD